MKEEFKKVFSSLREKNIALDRRGYNICIHAFGCWGDLETSLRIFREMKESSTSTCCDPDLCTYNSLIHVLCLNGKVKDALSVWEDLKYSGHEPDAFTYRILIQGCSKSYRVEDASRIFNEMQCNGFHPDIVVYNSLLDGYLKARKLTEACQLFEKMTQEGVRATCWTYNILIDGLIKNGQAIAGYTLFCDLKKKGQFLDGITYSVIILHLCRESQIEEALHLVEEMEGRGFVLDLVMVTSLLIGLYKQGRWDSTERLMRHIRDGSLLHNVLMWKAKMEASLKHKQKREDFAPIFPAEGNFGEIVDLLTVEGGEDSGIGSGDGKCSDFESDPDDVDDWKSSPYMERLANEATSDGQFFKWFSLSKGRRVQGKADVATYNIIIQSLGKMGRADLASSILNKLVNEGGYLDIIMYNTLMNALGKARRVDEAFKLFEQMRKTGINPDIVSFNTLIEIHTKAGRLKDAHKLLRMMLDAGCSPNHVTDTILDKLGVEMEKFQQQKVPSKGLD